MDPNSGKLYPTVDDARAAGVANPVELRGREEDINAISAAVAEARRPVDDTHECPRDGCTLRVRANLLACRDHWARVSPATRSEVYTAYRHRNAPGGYGRHASAIDAAIAEMNRATS